jgi:HK97 family phage major capsid protein
MTIQPNMADLANDLRKISGAMPKMQSAVKTVEDHEARLNQVEQTASLAYDTAKRSADAALQAMAGGNGKGGQFAHTPHVRAFNDWLCAPQDSNRRGDLMSQEMDIRAAGTTQTGAGGGFSVPEPVADTIRARVLEISPLRRLATTFSVTSTGTKFLVNRNDATNAWVGETDPRGDTGEPTLDLRTPTYGTTFGLVEATEELLLDSAIDIGAWFTNSVAQTIAQSEGAAFVSGNGTNKPTGFLAGPTPLATGDSTRAAGNLQFVPTGNAALITIDSLSDLFFATKAQHRQSGSWLMSSATAAVIAKLKDGDGRSIWQTSLSADTPSTLLGRPVVYDENMPALAGNAFPVAFGDFRAGYLIADSGALRITLDDNVTKPGYVRWYVRRRVGGVIYDSDAIKLLKVSLT